MVYAPTRAVTKRPTILTLDDHIMHQELEKIRRDDDQLTW